MKKLIGKMILSAVAVQAACDLVFLLGTDSEGFWPWEVKAMEEERKRALGA